MYRTVFTSPVQHGSMLHPDKSLAYSPALIGPRET